MEERQLEVGADFGAAAYGPADPETAPPERRPVTGSSCMNPSLTPVAPTARAAADAVERMKRHAV